MQQKTIIIKTVEFYYYFFVVERTYCRIIRFIYKFPRFTCFPIYIIKLIHYLCGLNMMFMYKILFVKLIYDINFLRRKT